MEFKAILVLIAFGEGLALKIVNAETGKGLGGEKFKSNSQRLAIATPKGSKYEATINTGLIRDADCPELLQKFQEAGVEIGQALQGFTVTMTAVPKVKKGLGVIADEAGF